MDHPLEKDYPMVTVVIPARNEAAHIGDCLSSLVSQDYPRHRMEILVLDGMSEDSTAAITEAWSGIDPRICLLTNKRKIIPSALNMGIRVACGEIILRADAHARYEPEYVRRSVELLVGTGASAVGGVIHPLGEGLIGGAIAIAVSSPFGVGNSYHRFASKPLWVDTLAWGCWRRETLLGLGGYNECYLANEDYELNYRLRQKGGKILLSPAIRSTYRCRSSLRGLFRQYMRYGTWKVKTLVAFPESMVYRQAAPPLFVIALALSLLLLPWSAIPFLAVGGPYLLANLLYSARVGMRRGLQYIPMLPLVFFIIHSAWGIGFLSGLRRFGMPNLLRILKGRHLKTFIKVSREFTSTPSS